MVYIRSEGTGCPYCTGRKVTPKQGGLVKQFPLLTAEWDIEKNAPLTPQDVTTGSHKLIWWRCPKGHSYRSAVKTRAQGSGCPYCAGKNVLPEETSLAAEYPVIAKDWDAAKNKPLTPDQVISGSLVALSERAFVARGGVFEDDPRHGLSGLHRTAGVGR